MTKKQTAKAAKKKATTVKKKAVKKKKKKQRATEKKQHPSGVVVTTSRGVKWLCQPAAVTLLKMESNIHESIDWPDTPSRIIEGVGGAEMELAITQEYIDADRATEEEATAWEAFKDEWAIAQAEYNERIYTGRLRFMATEGGRPVNPSIIKEWIEQDEWLQMEVPEDPRERALHFFQTRVIGNAEVDMVAITIGIFKASGFDREKLDEYERSFRASMGSPEGSDAADDPKDTGPPKEEEQKQPNVAPQHSADPGPGKEGTKPDSGSVGAPES